MGDSDQRRQMSRRRFLKLLGAAGAASAAGYTGLRHLSPRSTPTGNAVNLDDSAIKTVEDLQGGAKRVVIKSGATWTPSIGSGGTMENLLIDISADRAGVVGTASGDGWTIRNVGVKGITGTDKVFTVSGSNGTVENLYLGDGSKSQAAAKDGGPNGTMGFWVDHGDTEGPLNFRNVHISKFANNGIYGSPTADQYTGGIMNIYDSYFDSNNISAFKIGSPLGQCEVVNTTIRTDSEAPATHDGLVNKRTIWALNNSETVVRDCDIQGPIATRSPNSTIILENTRWDGSGTGSGEIRGSSAGSPDLSPPSGVPMSAEEAATGTSSAASTTSSSESQGSGSPC